MINNKKRNFNFIVAKKSASPFIRIKPISVGFSGKGSNGITKAPLFLRNPKLRIKPAPVFVSLPKKGPNGIIRKPKPVVKPVFARGAVLKKSVGGSVVASVGRTIPVPYKKDSSGRFSKKPSLKAPLVSKELAFKKKI